MSRVKLCRVDAVDLGTVRRFEPGGDAPAVAVASCDDGLHAVVDNCSHEDYPLSDGEVYADVCEIECARHGSTFSLVDGEPQSLPAVKAVRVLDLEIVDGDVFVDLP